MSISRRRRTPRIATSCVADGLRPAAADRDDRPGHRGGRRSKASPPGRPDSATVYFHRGDPNTATNADIYRKPAGGGTETLAVSDSGISEAQPSISPDGTKICYTLTNGGFNSTADVVVGTLTTPPSGGIIVSKPRCRPWVTTTAPGLRTGR